MKELARIRAMRRVGRQPNVSNDREVEVPVSYLDNIETQPDRGSLRVYFQNVNTFKIGSDAVEEVEAMRKLAAVGASVVCLSEVNKNLEAGETRKAVQMILDKARPGMVMSGGGNAH